VVYGLDRLTKALVLENLEPNVPVDVVGDLLRLTLVNNPGGAFSLGGGSTWIFAVIALAVAVFIVVFARRIRSLAWAALFGLLLGGTVGNLTDRLTRPPGFGIGHVTDFIVVKYFPAIFNVADIAIVVSMGIFILLTLRGVRLDGLRARPQRAAVAETSASAPAAADVPAESTDRSGD
jgi:signal peptidase II